MTFPHSASIGPGLVEGLLGSDMGWNSDFRLADGTILDPQISMNDLYGVFADAWRVTDAASLFDSPSLAAIPEPTSLTLLSVAIGLTGIGLRVIRRRAASPALP